MSVKITIVTPGGERSVQIPVETSLAAVASQLEQLAAKVEDLRARVEILEQASPAPEPINCELSDWSEELVEAEEWSPCVNGQQSRLEMYRAFRTVITEPQHGGAACGPLEEERSRLVTRSCVVDPGPGPGTPHAYFDMLSAHPKRTVAVSLRSQAEINLYRNVTAPRRVTYDYPNDPDPRRQDLAKVVIPEGFGSINGDIRVPLPAHAGKSALVTWDQWVGKEWHFAHTELMYHKGAPYIGDDRSGGGFLEYQISWRLARQSPHNQPPGGDPEISPYDGLPAGFVAMFGPNILTGATPHYPPYFRGAHTVDANGVTLRVRMPPGAPSKEQRNYGEAPGPQRAEFGIRAERKFRSWWLLEPLGGRDWQASVWVADVDRDPVLITEDWKFTADVDSPFRWWKFHLAVGGAGETAAQKVGRGDLTMYLGNIVELQDVTRDEVLELLERPVAQE